MGGAGRQGGRQGLHYTLSDIPLPPFPHRPSPTRTEQQIMDAATAKQMEVTKDLECPTDAVAVEVEMGAEPGTNTVPNCTELASTRTLGSFITRAAYESAKAKITKACMHGMEVGDDCMWVMTARSSVLPHGGMADMLLRCCCCCCCLITA